MNGCRFPLVLALAAAGAMAWLCSMPIAARSAEQRATEQRFVCPLWLKPDAFKADRPPEGWTAVMPQEWRLNGGGLLHGAPNESGYLKPYDATTTKKGDRETGITRWKLSQPHPYETWMYCGYGPLELFKRIPVDATECTATINTEGGAFVGTVFVCK
jgi:hypothetical protein